MSVDDHKKIQIGISLPSFTTSKLELYFNDLHISTGTCFFWNDGGRPYVVTNWHNLSEVNPVSGRNMDEKNGARPNKMKFWFARGEEKEIRPWMQPLEEGDGQKLWFEHPAFGRKVDVACAPILFNGIGNIVPLKAVEEPKIFPFVANEVFILGYPKFVDAGGLPVWKRGSIASEPEIDVDGLPKLLVDTATMRGMSGSPVVMHTNQGMSKDGAYITSAAVMNRLVGVYSGRVETDGEGDVQLGIVWKERVIDEIIDGGRRAPQDI